MALHPPSQNLLWPTFVATVERRGTAVALDFGTATVSFRDLADLALRAAATLQALGVGAGDVVALQLPKRATTYALILGCLRLGAIYAPLDPKNPAARTLAVLGRIRPKVLITAAATPNPYGRVLAARADGTVDTSGWAAPLSLEPQAAAPRLTPADAAYIMHTSGSTGEPKGAVIPHQGVCSLMRWSRSLLGDADQHCFTALNPLHFDNSVFDLYCGLVAGATLVPIETADAPDPSAWVARITAARASVLFSVPTMLLLLDKAGLLTPASLPHVRAFVFGGEGFPIDALQAAHARFNGHARLINVYGPTETSCICSSLEIDAAALAAVNGPFASLGRMHAEFSHRVVDADGHPVATDATGELWIGGANVGLGYFGQPEETARRFVQDPQHNSYRRIFYRTGDLVREDAQGYLWFQGRADNQVKLAGHRVELEEIDRAVESCSGVTRALSVLVDAELVTVFEASAPIAPSILATAIAARLPAYMRPTRFIQSAALPLNANGKADRRAVQSLATPRAASSSTMAEPSTTITTTHARVRDAWRLALGQETFADTDSFFDLGGTSLGLMRVHATLTAGGSHTLSLIDVFANPTIERIVAFLDRVPSAQKSTAPSSAAHERARQQQAALQRARARSTGSTS